MSLTTNIIQQRNTGSITDKYLRLGQNIMMRKFDQNLVPTGSWYELWLGFRWRLDLVHTWSGSVSSSLLMTNGNTTPANPSVPFNEKAPFSIGICNTSGEVWGGTSIQNFSSISHSFGISPCLGNSLFGGLNLTGSTVQFGSPFKLTSVIAGNISSSNASSTEQFTIPCTPDQRNLYVIRFITGSSPGTWNAHIIHPGINSNPDDIIRQEKVADFFTASNWNHLTSSLGSKYTVFSSFTDVSSDQATHGYFDGIYLTWVPYYDCLEISDIIVRTI